MAATDKLKQVYLVEISDELIESWHPIGVYLHREAAEDCAEAHRGEEDGIRCFARVTELKVMDALGAVTCHNTSYRIDRSRFHCSECGFGCWVKDVSDGRDKLPSFCPNCGRELVMEVPS